MTKLRTYSTYLKERFGGRAHRIALDAGFGCPHRAGGRGGGGCVFCSPSGSGTGAFDQGIPVGEQMRQGIERLGRRGIDRYIAYFQAYCGTNADPDTLAGIYGEALDFEGVVGFNVGARPDQVPDEVLDVLREAGVGLDTWLELGLQSAHDETLKRINRGHDVDCFDEAAARADGAGIQVAVHVILGLPGETREQMMATARHVARGPVRAVKLHHLYVEQGTGLAESGDFEPLTEEAYIDLAIGFIRRLKPDCVLMRLAGQGPADRLIAPHWKCPPGTMVQRIEREMEMRGFRQGDLFR
jgi:radical SAM protein (TIGR01212 family)